MTSELSQITSTATFNATSRLATLSPKLRTQVLSGAWILRVRQTAGRIVESIQAQKRWVTSAMVLLLIAAVPIAFLTVADGDLGVLASFVEEIIPRNPPAIERNSNAVGGPGTPNDDPNASGLFTPDGTRTPGTDFAGAYISGVEHLSLNSSMLQIFVPAGAQGTYLAVVTASEGVDYRCVILYHYTDRIHCIGPSLPEGSQINVQLFKLDEVEGSQILVFETNYATGDFGPVATPSPAFPVYGGAFIWPDRFDGVEIRKEQQSSAMLAPLSALLGVLLIVIYRVQAHREHPLNHRLVDSHELEPAH